MFKEMKGDKSTSKTSVTLAGRTCEFGVNSDPLLVLRAGDSKRDLIFENRIVNEWLSTKEAAHFLSVSENALRIMVHRGQIRVYKFGRRLRFKLSDCQALFVKKGAGYGN